MPQVALWYFFLSVSLLSDFHSKHSHWFPTPIRPPVMLSPFFILPYRRLWKRIQKKRKLFNHISCTQTKFGRFYLKKKEKISTNIVLCLP
jgi:hypothetical protein